MARRDLPAASGDDQGPPKPLLAEIRERLGSPAKRPDDHRLADAYRKLLRAYRAHVRSGGGSVESWRDEVRRAMAFLGGRPDRLRFSMADYDHHRYGPFLAISNEGGGAATIRAAAAATPKGMALGRRRAAATLGMAVDGERLGGVGEVPIGPDEFADIWFECVDRMLMTTNVGSRANLRLYRRAPMVTLGAGTADAALAQAKIALAATFKPFFEAPGGPRPLTVFIEFPAEPARSMAERRQLLQDLAAHVLAGGIAAPEIQQLGLHVTIDGGEPGRDAALAAVDLASAAGLGVVSIAGVVRSEADEAISLPGLLNYLPPELLAPVLDHARRKGVAVRPVNVVDRDTVAREIWSTLNTARAMGFDLGKYALFPLTLEEGDDVVRQVQGWFPDWSAAPVFYVDQGILAEDRLYVGEHTEKGAEAWLRMVAKHGVKLVLIDTVDKSRGWKLVKSAAEPKGILTLEEIARLNDLAAKLGVRVMWAGGVEPDQAYEIGKLGVFGIYVTTAVTEPAPVAGEAYLRDPALAALKRPTPERIIQVKTLLEAGFFTSPRTRALPPEIRRKIAAAGTDVVGLAKLLPSAWRAWWRLDHP